MVDVNQRLSVWHRRACPLLLLTAKDALEAFPHLAQKCVFRDACSSPVLACDMQNRGSGRWRYR